MKKFTVSVIVVVMLVMCAALPASAAFDWKAYSGTEIKLLLNKHPYADAVLAHLNEFTEKTGLK